MAVLQLCMSQAENTSSFMFRLTNTKVFSLEEALFLVFHNWKQAAEEFFTPRFIDWVKNDLRLSNIAEKLNRYSDLAFSERLTSCLSVIDYFDTSEIKGLRKELDAWAKRKEWEKLKEQGDYLLNQKKPGRAVAAYKRALRDTRRVSLLNNLAIALMHTEQYDESVKMFREAMELEPENDDVKLNYAEACMYAGKTEDAFSILENLPPSEAVFLLLSELYSRRGDSENTLKNLISAAESDDHESIFRLTDYYIEVAEFDNAISAINRITPQNSRTAVKHAEIYKSQADFVAASKVLEDAVKSWPDDVGLWLELSECTRRNSDLERANQAIIKAISLKPESPRVKLELIKVRRAQSRPREYQEALRQLIDYLKNEYRESEEAE